MSEVIQKNNPSGNETAATIYYATWCPFCKKLIENLDRTETPYSLIDIDQSEEA
ncbi:glutaredoxin domain-containing protein, partial [Corynebacterium sp.]